MAKSKRQPKDNGSTTPKKLERMVKSTDWPRVFNEAAQKAYPEMEAYRQARAKSKATACCTVFY